jgi:hypothetical protein
MANKTVYRVCAPYVTLKTSANALGQPAILGFFEGATVPDDVSEKSIAHHLARGLIEEVPAKAMPVAAPRSDETGAAVVSQGPGSGSTPVTGVTQSSSAASADSGAGSSTAGAQPAAASPKGGTRSTGTTKGPGAAKAV